MIVYFNFTLYLKTSRLSFNKSNIIFLNWNIISMKNKIKILNSILNAVATVYGSLSSNNKDQQNLVNKYTKLSNHKNRLWHR